MNSQIIKKALLSCKSANSSSTQAELHFGHETQDNISRGFWPSEIAADMGRLCARQAVWPSCAPSLLQTQIPHTSSLLGRIKRRISRFQNKI